VSGSHQHAHGLQHADVAARLVAAFTSPNTVIRLDCCGHLPIRTATETGSFIHFSTPLTAPAGDRYRPTGRRLDRRRGARPTLFSIMTTEANAIVEPIMKRRCRYAMTPASGAMAAGWHGRGFAENAEASTGRCDLER